MRFLKKVILIAGLLLTPTLVNAQSDVTSVIIDQIVIEDPSNTTHPVIETALDLKSGDALSRDDLDEKLARGKQRLEALGYFKTVDLSLRKGQTRNHFDVVATLTPISSYYTGASYLHNRYLTGEQSGGKTKNTAHVYQLFVGSRDLGGSGLRSELSFNSIDTLATKSNSDFNIGTNSKSSLLGPALSLHDSSVFDSDFFIGLFLSHIRSQYRTEYKYRLDNTAYNGTFESEGHTTFYFMTAGRRFGLTTASLGVMRAMSKYKNKDTNASSEGGVSEDSDRYIETSAQAHIQYSNKSGLAQVEPGLVLSAIYGRTTAPEWEPPSLDLKAASTYFLITNQAFTPEINYQYFWTEVWSRSGERIGLERLYDVSLLYQYITAQNLVLAVKGGYLQTHGSQEYNHSYPKSRIKVSIAYATASFNFDVGFMYGESELDQDSAYRDFLPDPSRFTQ